MKHKLFVLLAFMTMYSAMLADSKDEILRLESAMLKYFSTNDVDTFLKITDRLKSVSRESGNERMFYKAWSNQAQFEATQQDYTKAMQICDDIQSYAREQNSIYGEYASMHAKAVVLMQKQDYAQAEQAFLQAVEFMHEHFPNESAGDDLQELMKIANHRKDSKAAIKYARALVEEPSVAPIHKGRGLYQLSQAAFKNNNIAEFNRIYTEMMALKKTQGIGTLKPIVEVNHYIMNGEYEKALQLCDSLDAETRAERKAVIYHRMGDDTNAYKYMQEYKAISDSIVRVSHGNVVASCFVQMNNERLQKEQQLLESQNEKLRARLYLIIGLSLILILLVLLYRHNKTIKHLQVNNKQLIFENEDAAKALEDLAELSYYDMKSELPLTDVVQPNRLGRSLTAIAQRRCQKGVTMIYQTELPDDFEIMTNYSALKKMLENVLDNAARFNHQGMVTLSCTEDGDNIRFAVSDTTPNIANKFKIRFVSMFTEEDNKLHYVGMTHRICQSIARLLKGRTWFDKEYQKGVRKFIEIPKNPALQQG